MDLFHSFLPFSPIFAFSIFVFSLVWIFKTTLKVKNRKREAPEAGNSWPVIGHLHLLRGPKPPHKVLSEMADKHGPIFSIKMGVHRVLIVSDHETAKECLTINDKAFASRPSTLALDLLSYNHAMFGFAPYGEQWRQVRKIATIELLSNYRLEQLRHVRESEIKTSLKELYQLWDERKKKDGSDNVLVDMKKWFENTTLNVILRMIVGKRIPSSGNDAESEKWKKALKDFFELSGKFVISDALPYLRWLDIGGDERLMKKVRKELDDVAQGWLEEHKRNRSSDSSNNSSSDSDFMDVMLSMATETEKHDADTINKATCLGLTLAASDTTMVTLTWALSLLLNNRDELRKLQQELDIHVGKDKLVEEADIKNLVYLKAIIKETLRLYPAAPLSVPHESMEDCTVSGYHIPAGTRLFINLSKLLRDPRVWSDPCEFRPQRFLTSHKDVDYRGQNFELIPFSSGRRMCPGVSFAAKMLELVVASVVQGFELKTPLDEAVDMSESIGLTNLKASPLQLLITPRLPSSCY
ncbi:cytochrome P450, family 82, subfamily C, polypeptide 4 [Hibiscus trionum]|uniref:Cytochrome P450, family 82, subfamily C, polypeptide 4 n=1 Tax=Hibiscus trionum TaxID=183268 RepID=A0A9W7IWM0_HIBTR|nr:cytochrome P450, family 82, subfamily C, polypeptide 4 [Hibiscus trionum]